MASVVYHKQLFIATCYVIRHTPYFYRLKALLLPLLVPVTVLRLANMITDLDSIEWEVLQDIVQCLRVEKCLLHIAFQTVGSLFKSLESCLASQR